MNAKVLTLGELIRTLRYRSKLSQIALARFVGVHFSSISRWEHDLSTDNMKFKHFVKIAQATHISLDDLLKASTHYKDFNIEGAIDG